MDDSDAEPGYLPRTEVANLVGVSISTIRRWVEGGDVRAEQRDGGTWFVHLEDAEQRRAIGAGYTPPTDEPATPVDPQAQLMAASTKHLAQLGKYIDTLQKPAGVLLGMLADENQRLRERCTLLETRHIDNVSLYEKMVSEQHQRTLDEQAHHATAVRKTEAWKTLLHYAPTMATMVAQHAGGAKLAGPMEEGAFRHMVAELSLDQVKGIADAMPTHMGALLIQVHRHATKESNGQTQKESPAQPSQESSAA